ncbi:bifunctional aminoglycoside phosphotransferase/ATP-binding protein [Nocardia sp. JMUB6875]
MTTATERPVDNAVRQGLSPELRETHTGLVVLFGDRAYKVKKPIATDFLDFSTPEARNRALRRELALNRRWASDVYLGLAYLTDPLGGPSEPVLVMRRMPESRRLSTLVEHDEIGHVQLDELAHVLAQFHRNARRGPEIDRAGSPDALRARWRILLDGLRSQPADELDPALVARVELLARRFVDGRAPLLAERIATGRILDGHGDLLTEDIFALPDGFRILDCLDFDDDLRHVDGLDDAAFLAMDLEFRGRPDLSRRFLDDYLRAAEDTPPASLRHHYLAYRATVRAKTNRIRAAQGEPGYADHARRHVDLAVRHLESGAVRLALVGGLPGTGKSTVATALARETGAAVISSDTVRAELRRIGEITGTAGIFGAGAYTPEAKARVYARMRDLARERLTHGVSVILDAAWTDVTERARATLLAIDTHTDLIALRCECPPDLAAKRIRNRRPGDSEATADIAIAMAANTSPWPSATGLNTTEPIEDTLALATRGWNNPNPPPTS